VKTLSKKGFGLVLISRFEHLRARGKALRESVVRRLFVEVEARSDNCDNDRFGITAAGHNLRDRLGSAEAAGYRRDRRTRIVHAADSDCHSDSLRVGRCKDRELIAKSASERGDSPSFGILPVS